MLPYRATTNEEDVELDAASIISPQVSDIRKAGTLGGLAAASPPEATPSSPPERHSDRTACPNCNRYMQPCSLKRHLDVACKVRSDKRHDV